VETSCISRFLIILLGYRDFSSESILKLIKIYSKVIGLGGSNTIFRVNSDVQMISLISEEWKTPVVALGALL